MQGKNLSLVLIIADENCKAPIYVLAFVHRLNCFINLHYINKTIQQRIIKDKYPSVFNLHLGMQIQGR